MAKRHHTRRHSSGFSVRSSLGMLKPAVTGAVGALAVNGITNYAIPEQFRAQLLTGNAAFLTRGAIAIALAHFGRKLPVVGPYAMDMGRGALIVILADLGKQLAMTNGVNLAGLGYIGPARVVNLPRGVARPGNMAGVRGMGMYVGQGARR